MNKQILKWQFPGGWQLAAMICISFAAFKKYSIYTTTTTTIELRPAPVWGTKLHCDYFPRAHCWSKGRAGLAPQSKRMEGWKELLNFSQLVLLWLKQKKKRREKKWQRYRLLKNKNCLRGEFARRKRLKRVSTDKLFFLKNSKPLQVFVLSLKPPNPNKKQTNSSLMPPESLTF